MCSSKYATSGSTEVLSKILVFTKLTCFLRHIGFYVITLRRGRTHPRTRPREQLLLQNYKA